MKFVKFKPIARKSGIAIGPESQINPSEHHFGGIFTHPDMDGFHIGTMSGGLSVEAFSKYEMTEITLAEARAIIQQFDPDASLDEDGSLTLPTLGPAGADVL